MAAATSVSGEDIEISEEVGAAAYGMGHKLVRGVVNTFTGIVELPMQTYKGYQEGMGFIEHEPTSRTVGTILGFFRGATHTIGRTATGVIDTALFYTADHATNEGVGIPFDADYSWQRGERYSLFEPNLKEGLMPYPRKFVRGLGDCVFGIVELPGQVVKGTRTENPVVGLPVGAVKGVWFSYSRIVNSVDDIVLFLIPNPADPVGDSFDELWPWNALLGEAANNSEETSTVSE